jgi:protein involved in polysaccharide export with SLBB domain
VYKSVLRTPQIDLLISGYGSSQIFVGGEVREAGAKNIKGELTIAQAIILAGGYLETARTQQIVVLRQGPNDPRPRLRVVDLRAALKGADAAMRVRPGDVIFVPKSRIAEVNQFLRQYVTNLIPFGISYNIGTLR